MPGAAEVEQWLGRTEKRTPGTRRSSVIDSSACCATRICLFLIGSALRSSARAFCGAAPGKRDWSQHGRLGIA